MSDPRPAGPLSDVRVLDLANESAVYCTKLLADLGADVIRVEPPSGDPIRSFGPFYQDRLDPNGSLFHWYYTTNRRPVVLDLDSAAGQATFRELAAEADLLVETFPPGYLTQRGLDPTALRARNPRLVHTSVTPFGLSGPHAGWQANDLVTWAMSGCMLPTGEPDRPPLRAGGNQSYTLASYSAAVACLAALYHQRRTGEGQAIELSMQDTTILQSESMFLFYQYWRRFVPRVGRGQHALLAPAIAARAKDGYCQVITLSRAQWDAVVVWLTEEGLAGDLGEERWLDPLFRLANRAHVHEAVEALVARYTRPELFAEGRRRGLALGSVQTPADLAADEALVARNFFLDLTPPAAGRPIRFPGPPYHFSETPWSVDPALVGAPAVADGVGWRSRPEPAANGAGQAATATGMGPLAGLRVLDFTWVLAGPFATTLLAHLGADVIKVEAPGVGDPLRGVPPFLPNGAPPNHSSAYNSINPGKKSITLNFQHPKGRDLARRLARAADVVIENFSPGTFERLIGDPEEWRRENPRLIVVRLSGFGQTGERSDATGYAHTLHAISGLTYLTGYDAASPIGPGNSLSDWIGGYTGATAVLAALQHRECSGRGQTIDIAQVESMSATLGPAILEFTANGHVADPPGVRLPEQPDAPQNVYPGRIPPAPADGPPETEAWIAIGVTSDDHWRGLGQALGDPDWARNPALATAAGRIAAADRIDAAIREWAADREPWPAVEHLQAHGVPAGVVQNGRDLFERDLHLRARNAWQRLEHPETGPFLVPRPPYLFERTPAAIPSGPPLLGQDTETVLREVLGLSEEEIAELIVEEVV